MASSLESNKIAAAVLTAGVVAMLSGFVAELLYHPHVALEENSYVIATGDGATPATPAAAEAPALEDMVPLLASADPAAGEKLVGKQCASCHSFDQGGANKVGPNLYGVVGRPIASHEGFSYSDSMHEHDGDTWTYEHLNVFLHKPKDFASGTKMSFRGFPKVGDRADVVAYLRTLSDNPVPLP